MLPSRFSRKVLIPLVPPARPRLRNTTTLLLQPRLTLAQLRPFTNPPKPDVLKTLRKIALARTLKTKRNDALPSEDSRRSDSLESFVELVFDDLTERCTRKRGLIAIHREAQQSMEELIEGRCL